MQAANEPFTYDVAIIGSGPAGASAARVLGQAGLNAIILEKAQIPRYKTCGGGILFRATKLIGESSIPVSEQTCHTAEFVLSENLRFTSARKDPIVFMTMRDAFDEYLTQRAVAAGANLRTHCTVHNVISRSDCVILDTNQGEIRATFVIAADGANGQTAKKAGWPDHRRLVPALECEVKVSAADFARLSRSARFDFHPVPNGYAWVFPKKSHLSIGVLTLNPRDVNLNHCFDNYLNYLGVIDPESVQRHGYVIPLNPRARVLARNRILLTGDAAGLADPITAEGITHAIQSGQLAGQAIAAHFPNAGRVCAAYNDLLNKKIIPELRWARRLAKILYGMPRLRDALFRWQGQRLTELMTDIVTGQTNYTDLMSKPMNYLRLFCITKRSVAAFQAE